MIVKCCMLKCFLVNFLLKHYQWHSSFNTRVGPRPHQQIWAVKKNNIVYSIPIYGHSCIFVLFLLTCLIIHCDQYQIKENIYITV